MTTWTLNLATIPNTTNLSPSWLKDGVPFHTTPDAQVGDYLDVSFEPPGSFTSVWLNLSWSELATEPNPNPYVVSWVGNALGTAVTWAARLTSPTPLYNFRAIVTFVDGSAVIEYKIPDPEMAVGTGTGG